MFRRLLAALLVTGALAVPAVTPAAPPGPPVPESITLPTKLVKGESAVGTVCLDRVAEEPTEIIIQSDNEFLATTDPSVVTIPVGGQCASFTVQTFDRFETTETVVISGTANGTSADTVLHVIPQAGVDLIEITKADVDKNFTRITITATSDEPGAVLTAFAANGVELGVLEQKGNRYTGRFDLTEPTNIVEVRSARCRSDPPRGSAEAGAGPEPKRLRPWPARSTFALDQPLRDDVNEVANTPGAPRSHARVFTNVP